MPRGFLSSPIPARARKIELILRGLMQKDIASKLGCSQQNVSYALRTGEFRHMLETALILMDMAGYEVKEKESL